jgi:hypothetical protein
VTGERAPVGSGLRFQPASPRFRENLSLAFPWPRRWGKEYNRDTDTSESRVLNGCENGHRIPDPVSILVTIFQERLSTSLRVLAQDSQFDRARRSRGGRAIAAIVGLARPTSWLICVCRKRWSMLKCAISIGSVEEVLLAGGTYRQIRQHICFR